MSLCKLRKETTILLAFSIIGVGLLFVRTMLVSAAEVTTLDAQKTQEKTRENPSVLDKEKIQGSWRGLSAERQGKKIPQVDGTQTWSFEGDQVTMSNNNGSDDWKATCKLNAMRDPKEIDFEIQGGLNQGKKVLGIYVLKGETLILCIGRAQDKRPTTLSTKEAEGVVKWELERLPPKGDKQPKNVEKKNEK